MGASKVHMRGIRYTTTRAFKRTHPAFSVIGVKLVHRGQHEILQLVLDEPAVGFSLLPHASLLDDRHQQVAQRFVQASRLDEYEGPADAHGALGLADNVLLQVGDNTLTIAGLLTLWM